MAPSVGLICVIDFCILVLAFAVNCAEAAQTLHELCKAQNKPVHVVEDNENRLFVINSTMDVKTRKLTYPKQKNRCHLEYKACPSCHFEVAIKNMTISPCSPPDCWCGFLELEEITPQYRLKYCGNYSTSQFSFESKTRHIAFDFVQNEKNFYLVLNITSRRNQYTITGMPTDEHFIESPFFPAKYPADYSAEYIFQSLDPKGHVQLLFLDFQLWRSSTIEVSGHNGYRVDTYNGEVFRPPPFTSRGMQLRLKFEANSKSVSKAGFRAVSTFLSGDWNLLKTPNTNCGGPIRAYGGTVSLNSPSDQEELVDCIWLIYPPRFSAQRYLFSAVIAQSKNIGIGSVLELRKGLTSVSSAVKLVKCNLSDCFAKVGKQEFKMSASVGIYIRFVGHVAKGSSLVISYCLFGEGDCNDDEFMCANGRCIQKFLRCDGFNHCTDNSDEEKCQDCNDNEFMCANGRCIQKFLRCDGFNHCTDNSDEEKCQAEKSTTSKTTHMVTKAPYIAGEEFPAELISLVLLLALSGLLVVVISVFLIINKWYKPRSGSWESRQLQLISRSLRRESRQPQLFPRSLRRESHQPQLIPISDIATEETTELPLCRSIDNPPSYEDVLKSSGRYPCLSYTSQNDAETSCSFTDFLQASNETLCSRHRNQSLDSLWSSELPFRNSATAFENVPAVSEHDARTSSHLPMSSSPCPIGSSNLNLPETSRRHCRSLDSELNHYCCHQKLHSCPRIHVVEPEYVVLQSMPNKNTRCMTLPRDYKLPQRQGGGGEESDGNCGASESIPSAEDPLPCSSGAVAENLLPQYECTVITSFPGVINTEIRPLFRNRCFSDSHRVTVVGLHSFFRKKTSSF